MISRLPLLFLAVGLAGTTLVAHAAEPIDRHALVTRHNPSITAVDKTAPFMVGNGSIGFTADITGLQTFPEQYSPLVPFMTQAQWAWHSFPNPKKYTLKQALTPVNAGGTQRMYPWLHNWEEAKNPAIQWLRENPHRFSLGRLSLRLMSASGKPAAFEDLSATRQSLDMWTGRLSSSFVFDGAPVEVETSVHPTRDIIIVRLKSPLLFDGRLGVDIKFPGVSAKINPDPADWEHPESHSTQEISRGPGGLMLTRQLDDTRYSVKVASDRELDISAPGAHAYRMIAPGASQLTLLVEFAGASSSAPLPDAESARTAVAQWWESYWSHGGVIDFTGSTDPRAAELERRIVLSQYLTALNSAGDVPPQEEGLFSNSWNGKFHLEMHIWHSAHFALWSRPELLERSMPWYFTQLPEAKKRAKAYGVKGAWWPKMTGPEGRESPSTVNPFIMWQQPSPIYLSEVIYIARPERATLEKYKDIVFATADLLASYPRRDRKNDRYVLGPPLIPAQETHPPLTTFNPTFELEYWRFGLETAQLWRTRLGMERVKKWDKVLLSMSWPPEKDGLYLGAESEQDLWARSVAAKCSKGNTAVECPNRDHPSFLAAFGLLPGRSIQNEHMRCTLDAVVDYWDLRQTWGWDWPMMAMTAARLRDPDLAVQFLTPTLAKNFQFGISGMTPRVHLDQNVAELTAGAAPGLDGPGYRRVAETYFPSNGALLLAVGLMAAGEQDPAGRSTGPIFPHDGTWTVRSEGIHPLP